jgi:hypothetical protein
METVILLLFVGFVGVVLAALFFMIAQNSRIGIIGPEDPNRVWDEISQRRTRVEQMPEADISFRDIQAPRQPSYSPGAPLAPTARGGVLSGCGDFAKTIVTTLVIVAVGVGMMVFAYFQYNQYQQAEDWATTEGQVQGTNIDESYDSENDEYSYTPSISYSYEVDGETYESDQLDFRLFEESFDSEAEAREVIDELAEGGRVTVIYDPDDPATSVLRREYDDTLVPIIGLAGGLVVLGAAGYFLFKLLESSRNATMQPVGIPG